MIETKVKIDEFRQDQTFDRTWVHVDMDMFYAACEIRNQPELKEKAIAIGDMNMIQSSNYVARKFGVRSAMPGFLAR